MAKLHNYLNLLPSKFYNQDNVEKSEHLESPQIFSEFVQIFTKFRVIHSSQLFYRACSYSDMFSVRLTILFLVEI